MCGISVEVFACSCHRTCAQNVKKIPDLLLNRGPDASSCITVILHKVSIVLKGTVLWLQGSEPVPQPIRDEDGNVFLYNGDVLAGNQVPVEGQCDSVHLLQQLQAAGEEGVPGVMSGITGPWAFIYLHVASQRLYFGRDVLGRHSLLWSKTGSMSQSNAAFEKNLESDHVCESYKNELSEELVHSPSFVVSSLNLGVVEMEEVPAKGIFILNLKDLNCAPVTDRNKISLALVPWTGKSNLLVEEDLNVQVLDNSSLVSPILKNMNMTLPELGVDHKIGHLEGNVLEHLSKKYVSYTRDFLFLLQQAVQRRVNACPPYCNRCTHNRLTPCRDCCTGSGSNHHSSSHTGAAPKNLPLTWSTDSTCRATCTQSSCKVIKCGCVVTDQCKCACIGMNNTSEVILDKGVHDSSNNCSSVTSHELERLSHNGTAECTLMNSVNNSRGSHRDTSSCFAGGEYPVGNVESCMRGKRACCHCRIAVLFSGGLDSAMIALLLDRCLPKEECIDLINVAFPAPKPKEPSKPKKNTRVKKPKIRQSRELIENENTCGPELKNLSENIMAFKQDEDSLCDAQSVHAKEDDSQSNEGLSICLVNPIEVQNSQTPDKDRTQLSSAKVCKKSFESPEICAASSQNVCERTVDDYEVPDRCTGRECLEQLRSLCPERRWNFVEVNVSRDELQQHRADRISSLLRPHNTVLDDSIGCALWFAGRARGQVLGKPYTSSARVLLCGHGADEQLCGYSRHRSVYSRGGLEALLEETRMEVARLPSRNLGRDDRVLADSARAPRFPYLDEDVVSYLNSLPIWVKADLRLPRGVGEKLLLRVLAHQLGLTLAAGLPKRAIQFGSRIAKMDDRKEKGDQVCGRLLNR